MDMFDVPGWTVPSGHHSLQSSSTSSRSKASKRKRASTRDEGRLDSAVTNMDKIMAFLDEAGNSKKKAKTAQKKGRGNEAGKGQGRRTNGVDLDTVTEAMSIRGSLKKEKRCVDSAAHDGVAKRRHHDASKHQEVAKTARERRNSDRSSHIISSSAQLDPRPDSLSSLTQLTPLQKGMKDSLEGARFRWINESLYKFDSTQAHKMMKEDPRIFEEYHVGFRHQVQSWPLNPVAHYINSLSTERPGTVIADLGCGEAALARALLPKGIAVISFDLISDGAYVVESDICEKIPLPGSESAGNERSEEAQIVDIVVCALALMGKNWVNCLNEAWRILKHGGQLKIAEVTSRFTDVDEFVSLVCSIGFRLKAKDTRNTHFTLFEFDKMSRKPKIEKEWNRLLSKGGVLQPCEYKRR